MIRHQSIGVFIYAVTALLVALVVIVFTVISVNAFHRLQDANHTFALVETDRELYLAKEHLRIEQGAVNAVLYDDAPANAAIMAYIQAARQKSEAAFGFVIGKLRTADFAGHDSNRKILLREHADYDLFYKNVLAQIQRPSAQREPNLVTRWHTATAPLVDSMEAQSAVLNTQIQNTDPVIYEMSKVAMLAWAVRDVAGNDRHQMDVVITNGKIPSNADWQILSEDMGRIDAPWTVLGYDMRLETMPRDLKTAYADTQKIFFRDFKAKRSAILDRLSSGAQAGISLRQWWGVSEPGLTSIGAIPDTAFTIMQAHAARQVQIARQSLIVSVLAMLALLATVLLISLLMIVRVVRPLGIVTDKILLVAGGDLESEIPFTAQKNEIGKLARALKLFRDNALAKQALEVELIQNQLAKEAAETSNRVRTQFFANMSHELRTPLNAIIGFSDLMQQGMFGPLGARYEEYAGLIHQSGNHLLDLVSDILDLAKIEAGTMTLHIQTVNLVDSLNNSLRMVEKRARDSNISVTKEAPKELFLDADSRAMKQVILNLLSNAVKFTPAGGHVHVAVVAKDGRVKLIVRDNGIGIPADAMSRIGHAFEQVSNDPTLAREGTGLGLALVRALVEQHKGQLSIQSEEGTGTTVTVELPLAQSREQRNAA